jgi:hypothetical protein
VRLWQAEEGAMTGRFIDVLGYLSSANDKNLKCQMTGGVSGHDALPSIVPPKTENGIA